MHTPRRSSCVRATHLCLLTADAIVGGTHARRAELAIAAGHPDTPGQPCNVAHCPSLLAFWHRLGNDDESVERGAKPVLDCSALKPEQIFGVDISNGLPS